MHMSNAILGPAIPQLPTADIEVTAEFVERALGFEVVARFANFGHLIVQRGPAEIHFWRASSEQEARAIAGQSSCYIRVEHVEALYDELKRRGAPFGYELTRQPWGMHEMQVNDPYGNAIRFGERFDR